MKAPLALRTELAWTLLTGRFVSISYGKSLVSGEHCWQFEVEEKPKGWVRSNKRRAKKP